MKMKDIAIYGAGGYGREVACYVKTNNAIEPEWNIIGFFDDGIAKGTMTQYGEVLGGIDVLNEWSTELAIVFAIGTPKIVKAIVGKITNPRVFFPNIIDRSVCFLDKASVTMGMGNVIGSNSLISCDVVLGNFNLLNVYDQVGHDTVLGDFNILMPTVNISGGVTIGDCNLFGVKSTVLQYLKVGNGTIIGSGSVLMKDSQDDTTYIGCPARPFFVK